jgi:serine/threonine protein phosphatase PrpC
VKAVALFGRSQQELGAIGEQSAGDVAVVLTRGGAAKPYAHTDPNEDAALAARGARGSLVAVADGHWGARSAEIAVELLRDRFAADWLGGPDRSSDRWYQDVLHALAAINAAMLAEQTEDARSRTTLALALARESQRLLIAASVGDSHLFVVTPDAVREILPRSKKFAVLGHETCTVSQLERFTRFDVRPLDSIECLVGVTDGLSETGIGVEDAEVAVREAIDAARAKPLAERAASAARRIVDAALAAHAAHKAGDNVAAAVAWSS